MRLRATRVRLDQGGYDRNGRYFGDNPYMHLYRVESEDGAVDTYVRALDAKGARARVARNHGVPFTPTRRTYIDPSARERYRAALAFAEGKLAAARSVERIVRAEAAGVIGTKAYWYDLAQEYLDAADALLVAADAAESQGGITANRAAERLRHRADRLRSVYVTAYHRYAEEAQH